jgi:hypothetical protein
VGGNGTANTGGGGGGGEPINNLSGGTGGSGIVVVRYLTADLTPFSASGGTVTTSGNYTVHSFTSTGSSAFILSA